MIIVKEMDPKGKAAASLLKMLVDPSTVPEDECVVSPDGHLICARDFFQECKDLLMADDQARVEMERAIKLVKNRERMKK